MHRHSATEAPLASQVGWVEPAPFPASQQAQLADVKTPPGMPMQPGMAHPQPGMMAPHAGMVQPSQQPVFFSGPQPPFRQV
jgi:hypothetical protein